MVRCFSHAVRGVLLAVAIGSGWPAVAGAQERLCDNSFEDCRTPILNMIRAETVGIDVSFWFMDDARYANEIIKRWQAGVRVRILLDPRADANYPVNATVRQTLIKAGIPIRYKTTAGINHWKLILYAGQNKLHFSPANFSDGSYSPIIPYTNYVDEAVYFTDDPAVVQSFMTKYDDIWTDTANWANLANVTGPLTRRYPTFPISPDLNFPPDQNYQTRLLAQIKLETQAIDAAMFRITSSVIPDALIARRLAGVNVRLITDQNQYRNPSYFWDSYNVDRMAMAGIPIKWKDNTSEQDMHQKTVVLYSRGLGVFGSSNWTASSSDAQREHNYFTTKAWFVEWLKAQFTRKWTNTKAPQDGSAPISPPMFLDFAPLPPETPVYGSPANQATGQHLMLSLKWEGGYWAHKYDIYLGTSNPPPLIVQDFAPGSASAGVNAVKESYALSSLLPQTTYYWRIVSKTMANQTKTGPTWSFTTAPAGTIPTAPTGMRIKNRP
jgi:phosphatidylserine/phosphatidylglycerophosphate/cardiolipin synthase-like enzyme